jgi:hypothetical protein
MVSWQEKIKANVISKNLTFVDEVRYNDTALGIFLNKELNEREKKQVRNSISMLNWFRYNLNSQYIYGGGDERPMMTFKRG